MYRVHTLISYQGQECHFFVIIDQMAQIVDVVSQMNNGYFIKCIRVDQLVPQPPPTNLNDCNFECGHEIISNKVVHLSQTRAISKIGHSDSRGTQYHGNLYTPVLNYWIYPISENFPKKPTALEPKYTYYIVLTPFGEIKDVIAKLMHNDFMKCACTTKAPDDSLDRNLEVGFRCGTKFIGFKHVKRTALHAKRYSSKTNRLDDFPKPYDGPGSRLGQSMFPILINGRFYIGGVGRMYRYFLVLNPDFEIEFVVTKTPESYRLCD
ncbi:hypothetical protein HI914_05868 [Erysiphe necator]|nr:hypothetical protein HI914_05868 [Erysiphe necator]